MQKYLVLKSLIGIELNRIATLDKLDKLGIDMTSITDQLSTDSEGTCIADVIAMVLGVDDINIAITDILMGCVDRGITDIGEIIPIFINHFKLDVHEVLGLDESKGITIHKEDFDKVFGE